MEKIQNNSVTRTGIARSEYKIGMSKGKEKVISRCYFIIPGLLHNYPEVLSNSRNTQNFSPTLSNVCKYNSSTSLKDYLKLSYVQKKQVYKVSLAEILIII